MSAGFPELSAVLVVRMVLSVVYFLSGTLKLFDVSGFARVLIKYHVFNPTLAEVIAYTLPPAEIVLGILLFTDSYVAVLAILACIGQGLAVFFTGAALHDRGRLANSGWLGTAIGVKLSWNVVAANVVLLGMTVFLAANSF